VGAGHKLSLQYHESKVETLLFLAGEGHIQIGEDLLPAYPGVVVDVQPGTVHRIVALTDLTAVEVSTPELDDVVRLEDAYGRAGGVQ